MPDFTMESSEAGLPPKDGRLVAQAFNHNHAAISSVIENLLEGHTGNVLEIGSGTGQHAVAFASHMPTISWWPTDRNDNHLRSIAAWRNHAKLDNLKEPIRLDASAADWKLEQRGLPAS